MSPSRTRILASLLRQILATGGALLVFGLGLMAVNPALHDLAHGHAHEPAPTGCGCGHHHGVDPNAAGDTADADHLCAVVLFAQGITFAVETIAPATHPVVWHETVFAAVEEALLTAPRYLHQPGRGPPAV
ncbi:MAG: hypothetical protein RLZZ129_1631 [Verrucomicrobiota bacterium]